MYSYAFLIIALTLIFSVVNAFEEITVSTNVGDIKGLQENFTIGDEVKVISKFYSIPFAESTTGSNRFEKPIPRAPFDTTLDATGQTVSCIQSSKVAEEAYSSYNISTNEDCLVLNVYVPHDLHENVFLPVMIWIHGGGFVEGSSLPYRVDGLCAYRNVVVVTINYRLGPFGFLRSKDGKLIGNQGLWDQHLGIKWVHDNIMAFSGDPNDVTIFGESAGGASVLSQALYAGNRGLFQRVIAESGSPLSYWGILPESNAELFMTLKGCEKTSMDPIDCLRSLSTDQLQVDYGMLVNESITFRPVVDNDFFIAHPMDIVFGNDSITAPARNFFGSLDIVVGFNNYDGVVYFMNNTIVPNSFSTDEFTLTQDMFYADILPTIVKTVVKPENDVQEKIVRRLIQFEYTDWETPDDSDVLRMNMVEMVTDFMFAYPALAIAEAHARIGNGTTYMYVFSANPTTHLLPTPTWINGSNHAEEMDYVFGFSLYPPYQCPWKVNQSEYSEEEKDLTSAMITLWTNFATSGNPNEPVVDCSNYWLVEWPEYDSASQQYLVIGTDRSSVQNHLSPRRMQFWSQLVPSVKSLQNPQNGQDIVSVPGLIIGK